MVVTPVTPGLAGEAVMAVETGDAADEAGDAADEAGDAADEAGAATAVVLGAKSAASSVLTPLPVAVSTSDRPPVLRLPPL